MSIKTLLLAIYLTIHYTTTGLLMSVTCSLIPFLLRERRIYYSPISLVKQTEVIMSKITEFLSKDFTFSLEITPKIALDSLENVNPMFFAVTWHAKSHQCKGLDIAPLKLASHLTTTGRNVLLHITCDMMRERYLDELLPFLQEKNIRNLFVVLGEDYDPKSSDYTSSINLIRHIRQKTGPFFCIGVVGFPDCSESRLTLLKDKVDEGADFIITQAFFEADVYRRFVNRCRHVQINVPIIPGIFLYETQEELMRFIDLCRLKISDTLQLTTGTTFKETVSGQEIIQNLMKEINIYQTNQHFHFFSLNNIKKVSSFIKEMNTLI